MFLQQLSVVIGKLPAAVQYLIGGVIFGLCMGLLMAAPIIGGGGSWKLWAALTAGVGLFFGFGAAAINRVWFGSWDNRTKRRH